MKLIVDSGGTKTDWAMTNIASESAVITTPSAKDAIVSTLPASIISRQGDITNVYYYGAGLYDSATCDHARSQLSHIFTSAKISCHSDLLGGCRATAARQPGIVCILGTGSNSCTYDGNKIVQNHPALGYIMGDEGSGAAIGKEMIKSYLYGEWDAESRQKFESVYQVTKASLLKELNKPTAATYLASFARHANDHKNVACRAIVKAQIEAFISRRVLTYDDYSTYPIHFVGSIAYFYGTLVNEVCEQAGLSVSSIQHKPINGLIAYHK